MSYIGNEPPDIGAYGVQSFDGGGTSFTLSKPSTTATVLLFIDGVRQTPVDAYSVSGVTLTTTGTTPSGTDNVTVQYLGDVVDFGEPSDDSVSTAKIQDDAVNAAKMADDAVGIAVLSATGTASSSTYLRGDNAWSTIETGTSWQAVTTGATLTAVAGNGYPINTTSNECVVTLPASASVGDTIEFVDYAGTWDTNRVELDPQSLNIKGASNNLYLTYDRQGVRIVYVDVTQGWVATTGINESNPAIVSTYIADFLVVAGGGGGSIGGGGGGGAGGYRNSYSSESSGGGGSSESPLTLVMTSVYTVTVGTGGPATTVGVDSSITGADITNIVSAGGGKGGQGNDSGGAAPGAGGSGGGGGKNNSDTGGAGTANQGYAGGNTGASGTGGGGGGGASAVGGNATTTDEAPGPGGNGLSSSITAGAVVRGGGGGGGQNSAQGSGTGGTGGGGAGGVNASSAGTAGTVNTGGGGGGGGYSGGSGGAGGSGVVILRMPTANYSGTTTGSPTVSTSGADTILLFNASGSYTG